MTAESRITRSPLTRAMKASKQLGSSVSASAPLKRHVPVPTLGSMKGALAKSPSTSSSDSSSGKRGLNGGKAGSDNRKTSQGTTDPPTDARVSSSDSSDETTGTEFEASNELSLDNCIELDETKRITDMAEPSLLIPELQLKDLDVVHSNLAVSWFNVGDHDFDDFLITKADQLNPHMTGSEEQKSQSAAADTTVTPTSLPGSINRCSIDEFEGAIIGSVCCMNTPLQDKTFEDGKADVVEELSLKKTPDVIQCSEGKDSCQKYEDESSLPETSEGTSDVKPACENLMRQTGHGMDALRGWRAIKLLLPASLLVLLTALFCMDNLIDGVLGQLPPPT